MLLVLPLAVVRVIAPFTVPGITIATTVSPLFDTLMAATPPMITDVVLLMLVPIIVTTVPTAPEVGKKELIIGCCAKPLNDSRVSKNKNIILVLFVD